MFEKRFKSHHDVKDFIDSKFSRTLLLPGSYWNQVRKYDSFGRAGIYVHIPYCDKICSFCNMNRKIRKGNLDSYTEYLLKSIDKYNGTGLANKAQIDVIYLGGGTPTILNNYQLERILRKLHDVFWFDNDIEFTFESTLHNLHEDKLEMMQEYGVNRLSLGIQTFSDNGRRFLNRSYDGSWAKKRAEKIKKKFDGLVCADIIYNYPNQTIEDVIKDAQISSRIGFDSISFYSLMIQKGSVITKEFEPANMGFANDIKRDFSLFKAFLLESLKNKYKILEVTKLTNGGDKYRYIQKIHQGENLIPIGIGAGGRFENIEIFNLNRVMTFYSEMDELKMRMKKIFGLLQHEYIAINNLKKLIGENFEKVWQLIDKFNKNCLLNILDNKIQYTLKGHFWANNISIAILDVFHTSSKNN
ncbi:MAG: radical SAM protein [Candidatus Zixiibacteriota bacterium]